ncbi:hypothetical protein PUNSTDRAFT_124455 [Punctularia strigosozonata HHB-11173 SS5]|uniref:uncharacterized protein n=1 Tax=Punctularia strigosozonata (strain HHB-11173) TaxID=741275 RepID=UPI00044182B7|nr:uncharacterized protein PUNSTDRAFT_124455 [Punctularia strigosozonata HHB-11173 SS5]EIN12748.1 hypothetical protein PUNSTDRAFT_124455 [Punctularia strigosozonata HHB-11173 SS5]
MALACQPYVKQELTGKLAGPKLGGRELKHSLLTLRFIGAIRKIRDINAMPEGVLTGIYDAPRIPQRYKISESQKALKGILKTEAERRDSATNTPSGSSLPSTSPLAKNAPCRRLFSAPVPRSVSLAAELADVIKPRAVSAFSGVRHALPRTTTLLAPADIDQDEALSFHQHRNHEHRPPVIRHCLLSPPESTNGFEDLPARAKARSLKELLDLDNGTHRHTADGLTADPAPLPDMFVPSIAVPSEMTKAVMPIGTVRPIPFTTEHLKPQTYNVVYGQLQVLSSRSVMIDFRERERKRGNRGDEVLVVAPSGIVVKVYAAPDLEEPCYLAEPVSVHKLDVLPSRYWRIYNDASRILEQVKQRIPKVIMYEDEIKFSLMCNGIKGDIEVLFSADSYRHPCAKSSEGFVTAKEPRSAKGKDVAMRIRVSRSLSSVEIVRLVPSSRDQKLEGEWKKKTLLLVSGSTVPTSEWANLDKVEARGLRKAISFMSVCEAVESVQAAADQSTAENLGLQLEACGPSAARRRGHTKVPTLPSTSRTLSGSKPSNVLGREAPVRRNTSSEHCKFDESLTMTPPHATLSSRFIPGVGWCIRHDGEGNEGQGARFKIMFFDGVILDVDVDGEWVEFQSASGEVTKLQVRECNARRQVGDRMKVFREFVSMFDTSSS